MSQAISQHAPVLGAPPDRYERLLEERITIGRLYVDALCHRTTDAERLFRNVHRLDRRLDRFRRYCHDQLRIVTPAEDERWHVPGEPPPSPGCRLCVKQDLGLLLQMALAPGATEVARHPAPGALERVGSTTCSRGTR
ncbi:hypothetical protein GCM10022197_21980 [Microlunatus spumicola]|uniref:Uncharacterized protein n=1 Tax=Microlunatus spumicola TaxID=81499 RepID=A0ABP6XE53_9ACTN